MIVEHLSLVDFRNYAEAELELRAGMNLLVGRNGQGKTNLAEAVAYLATLGSHRVSADAPLVRDGKNAAFVRARLAHGSRRVMLELQINKQGSNKARVSGNPVRTNELPRYAQVVLFAPEDLTIVRGDPSARRRFADQLLVQRTPRMAGVLADYDRTLRQRTTLLKSARARGMKVEQLTTLEVWDDKLISLGAQIIDARDRLANDLTDPLKAAYAAIAGDDHAPEIAWATTIAGADPEEDEIDGHAGSGSTEEQFRQALLAKRAQEIDRGLTLVGPHRDDLVLRLRGLPVKGYASHGESWSVALSLRLAAAELLRAESPGGDPILILDDVFAELDAARRSRLASVVSGYEQVIVTAAVAGDIPDPLRENAVRIEAGRVLGLLADHPLEEGAA
ncbi:DNA replication and repair protein RecF [Microbacterium sorbitolivorans]|uniref:DNA replication and repair protein RecF n=1 Tax=Microbacterium sorbitolivorans TaxID=1867410 RepID=A0A367Y2A1_9MICO|nr:DNA replication/repair protein RecF [Microbacterium sorbitolivorans]RCK60026.1 DNA replication/repair protein RecF [Microbacterium sorbitolivorans]GGF42103.1 DNA replication and repair protein RecF [Microbacterium sorbitolivorans]